MHCGEMQREEIAAGVIQGQPHSVIADRVGLDRSTITRHINKDQKLKKLIEESLETVTDVLPKALVNVKHVIEKFQEPMPEKYGKAELQMREFGYDASKRVMSLVGLGDSHSQAPMIQQIFIQNNNNQYISPLTDKAISNALNVIDSEVIQENE